MSKESELKEIIDHHQQWLDSGNEKGKRADFSGAVLDGFDLSGLDLRGANFTGASFKNSNFSGTNLYHANFADANLSQATFDDCVLILCDFSSAELLEAKLTNTRDIDDKSLGSNHRGPKFVDANLTGADLSNSYCVESDFSLAKIKQTKFCKSNLTSAVFDKAKFEMVDFSEANLKKSKLRRCELVDADFNGAIIRAADLSESNLEKADVSGADLRSTNLERCKVDRIKYTRKTRFRGVRVHGCYGASRFKRFAEDQDYIDEFKEAHPFAYWLWFLLTDCGRSMLRVAVVSFGISLLFAGVFFALGPNAFEIHNANGLNWSFFTALYYSVVTFTTLGYGDITPNTPMAASMVIAEVVVGYVMLGILISILANKVARRS